MKETLHRAMYLWWGDHAERFLIWCDSCKFSLDLTWNILVWEKKRKRFIRILRLTYGVTFVAFRDLGGGWRWGYAGGSNAPRTVGTLGRGELSPPITITAWAQKGGGVGGEQAKKKKKYWFLANRHLEPSPGLRTLSLQLPPGKHLHASPPHPWLAVGHNVCAGVKGGVSVCGVGLCKQNVWILLNKRTTVHVFLLVSEWGGTLISSLVGLIKGSVERERERERLKVKMRAKKRRKAFQGLSGMRLPEETLLIINNCQNLCTSKKDFQVIFKIMGHGVSEAAIK